MTRSIFRGVSVLLCLLVLIASLAGLSRLVAQTFRPATSAGALFVDVLAGEGLTANNAVFLNTSDGKAYKLTNGGAATPLGVVSYTTTTGRVARIQIAGKASVVADGSVSIGDKVGGTGVGTAGRVYTLVSTSALNSTAATVTSGALTGTVTSGALTGTVTSGASTGTVTSGAGTVTIGAGATGVTSSAANGAIGTSSLTSTATTGTLTSTATTGTLTSTALTGTLTSTAGTVTSGTVVGDNPASRVLGTALSAGSQAGTITILLASR